MRSYERVACPTGSMATRITKTMTKDELAIVPCDAEGERESLSLAVLILKKTDGRLRAVLSAAAGVLIGVPVFPTTTTTTS